MSETSRTFQAVVTVSDRTAGPLTAIQSRLRAIAGLNGLQRVGVAAGLVHQRIAGLAGGMGRLALPAALAGGGIIAGFAALVVSVAGTADQLEEMQQRVGGSAEGLQALAYAGRLAGVDSAALGTSLGRLNRTIGEAATGRNAEALALFRRLGINVRDSTGQLRTATQVLPQLAQAIMRNENPTVRAAIVTAMFGRAGEALLPMLTEGAAGLAKVTEEFRRYGHELSPEQRANGVAFSDTMDALSLSITGAASVIANEFIPVLTPLMRRLADFVRENREAIRLWAADIAESLRQVDFGAFASSIGEFVSRVGGFLDAIGGIRGALIGLVAIAIAPLIAALFTLTAAMITNPIGALITAVAIAIAAAAYLIYDNWDGIVAFFGGILDRIGQLFQSEQVTETLRIFGAAFGAAAEAIMAAWRPVGDFFTGLLTGITDTFATAWAFLRPIVEAITAAAQLLQGTGAGGDPIVQQERRRRFGARGSDGTPLLDPDTRLPAFPGAGSLLRPQSGAAATPGQVDVRVRFEGLPPGARVEATTRGSQVSPPQLNVGYATLGVP